MKRMSALFHASLVGLCLLTACMANVPRADFAATVSQEVPLGLADTWAVVEELARREGEAILTSDKESGLLVYVTNDESAGVRLYISVYVESLPPGDSSLVYVFPRTQSERAPSGADYRVFEALANILDEKRGRS